MLERIAAIATSAVAAVVMLLASPAHAATVHEVISVSHDYGFAVVPDNGIQPLAPRHELGWHATFRLRGTHIRFRVLAERDGRAIVWNEVS